jgi:hypothetical protein
MVEKTMPTPGPWHVLKDDETEHTVVGADLETICQTEFWGVSELPETQANAALIAAAGTAAHECAEMGYTDAVALFQALPELIRTLQEYAVLGSGRCKIGQPLADMNRAALVRAAGKEGE